MSTVIKDLGAATAYGYAVEKGYTGTEAEFAELMASYATVGQTAVDAKDAAVAAKTAAQTAATTATNKATEATTAATTATTKAGEASTSANTATSAKDTAVSASQTATTKTTEATTAAATATSAASTATTAKDDAVSAKTAAQTAQAGAETAAASVSASAAQIQTNADDINELKEELTTTNNNLKQQTIFSDIVFENGSAIYDIVYTNYSVSQTTGQQSVESAIRASSPQLYYIPFACELHVTYNPANQNIVVFCFSENGTHLGIKYGRDVADGIIHLFEGTRYVRFLVYNVDNSAITPEQASSYATYTCIYIGRVKETSDSVNELAQKFDRSFVNNNLLVGATLVSGYYNGERKPSDLYVYFPKIPVENRKTYTIYPRARMVYIYDANGNLINYLNQHDITEITSDGDGYAYITYYTADNLDSALFYVKNANDVFTRNIYALSDNIIVPSILTDKKWAVLGDSFTAGADSGTIQGGAYAGQKIVYPYLIGNRTGIKVLSFFDHGRTLAYPAVPGDFVNSITCAGKSYYYQNIPADVDYITIYLGINDSHHAPSSSGGDGEDNTGKIPLGTISDNTVNTYYGAWNVVLTWILTNRPFAHVGIIVSNGCDSIEYRTAQLEIAKKYGIPYIDLNGDDRTRAMIRPQNNDISATVKTLLLQTQAVDYAGGNYHPNNAAHEFESYIIEAFLRTI